MNQNNSNLLILESSILNQKIAHKQKNNFLNDLEVVKLKIKMIFKHEGFLDFGLKFDLDIGGELANKINIKY